MNSWGWVEAPSLRIETAVKEILRKSADDIEAPGFNDKTGTGRINAYLAVELDLAKTAMQSPKKQTDWLSPGFPRLNKRDRPFEKQADSWPKPVFVIM